MSLRSLLFLPGNTPKMLEKGPFLKADALIFDLEDAVAPGEKDAARVLVRNALHTLDFGGSQRIVRINAVAADGFWREDLRALIALRPDYIMLPKTENPQTVREVAREMAAIDSQAPTRLILLIETCLGLERAFDCATADPLAAGILLGAEDLTADMQCARTAAGSEILYARGRVVCAARAAGIDVYDTPYTDINNDEGLLADAQTARGFGFTGKAAISPRHVADINAVFTPGDEEIAYARAVLAAIDEAHAQGKGAVALRGKMIDKPIVDRARRVLASVREREGKRV